MNYAELLDPGGFQSIGWLLVSLACLAALVNQIDSFLRRRAGREDLRTIKFDFDPASKEELDKLDTENQRVHDVLFTNMRADVEGLRGELTITSAQMHELKGEIKHLSMMLVTMQQNMQSHHDR